MKNKNQTLDKLFLNRQTITKLNNDQLAGAKGGTSWGCYVAGAIMTFSSEDCLKGIDMALNEP